MSTGSFAHNVVGGIFYHCNRAIRPFCVFLKLSKETAKKLERPLLSGETQQKLHQIQKLARGV